MFEERTEVIKVISDGSSALYVHLGFKPRYVKVYNIDDIETWEWIEGMPAGYGFKTVTNGTISYATSGGITQYAGTDAAGDSAGVLLGGGISDAAADVLYVIAKR